MVYSLSYTRSRRRFGTPVVAVNSALQVAEEGYTKALVVDRTKNEDTSWLNDTITGTTVTSGWDVHVYATDDCPAEHGCYCDGYVICFGGREGFEGVI